MTRLAAFTAAGFALAASGCGSSSKSNTSTSSASAPAAASTVSSGATTSSGGYSYGGSTTSATAPSASTGAAGPAVAISTKRGKLGRILAAGSKRKTVYLFEADTSSSSTCTGTCAKVWPPVTGAAVAHAGAVSADLGTITRSDGTKQVTYKGHPLYFYARDGDAGDAYGQGIKSFGAAWYVLAPSGTKVDNS